MSSKIERLREGAIVFGSVLLGYFVAKWYDTSFSLSSGDYMTYSIVLAALLSAVIFVDFKKLKKISKS